MQQIGPPKLGSTLRHSVLKHIEVPVHQRKAYRIKNKYYCNQ